MQSVQLPGVSFHTLGNLVEDGSIPVEVVQPLAMFHLMRVARVAELDGDMLSLRRAPEIGGTVIKVVNSTPLNIEAHEVIVLVV